MFISVFDVFKIGIGPSSSHTMGPMTAANRFLESLHNKRPDAETMIEVTLFGSLAFTGRGHGTDRAVKLGLCGVTPDHYDHDEAEQALEQLEASCRLIHPDLPELQFDPASQLIFDFETRDLPHPNTLTFVARNRAGDVSLQETYCSIGGGFVMTAEEWTQEEDHTVFVPARTDEVPHAFTNAAKMLTMGDAQSMSIGDMKRANELRDRSEAELDSQLDAIWHVMNSCIERGLTQGGLLPGGLDVKRRSNDLHEKLIADQQRNDIAPHQINEWICLFAMAVNEENAAGGKVVTAPTNGAAGVIPAVIRYYLDFVPGASRKKVRDFLLVAAAIGGIIKHNASISGAEVGCQGEVGSASAMAAAGLCAVMGGSNAQIENAAEIALEHHLGMTCDPIRGLVQIPCIERNGLGAVKAVTAASLALKGDGQHYVSLDNCIETMRQTGLDMSEKYKETALGGLAVNVVAC